MASPFAHGLNGWIIYSRGTAASDCLKGDLVHPHA
jgi:hypothetical protein